MFLSPLPRFFVVPVKRPQVATQREHLFKQRPYHHASLKQELLSAALTLITETGPKGLPFANSHAGQEYHTMRSTAIAIKMLLARPAQPRDSPGQPMP